jgi:hypothetical protein
MKLVAPLPLVANVRLGLKILDLPTCYSGQLPLVCSGSNLDVKDRQ